jgi:hypothetical protein
MDGSSQSAAQSDHPAAISRDNVGMYDVLIVVHSLASLDRAAATEWWPSRARHLAVFTRRPWTPTDDAAGRWFVIASRRPGADRALRDLSVLQQLHQVCLAQHGRRDGGFRHSFLGRRARGRHAGCYRVSCTSARRPHPENHRLARRKHFLAAIFFGIALVLMLVSNPCRLETLIGRG